MIQIATDFGDEGDGEAMIRMGRAYRDGKGVEKNFNKTIYWMRKAYEKEWRYGRELVDNLLKSTEEEHHIEAFRICNKLVKERVDAPSMKNLGRMYRYGKGVDKDLDKAAEWMRSAIDSGRMEWVRNELFDILWEIGTKKSHEEMIDVIMPLVESGGGNAMGRLGRAYRDGKGVDKDLDKAAEWMRKAASKNPTWNRELNGILEK